MMPTPTAQNRSLANFFLEGIQSGKIQLPEFQREFIWQRPAQKELLESIVNVHPIGSLLLLQMDPVNPQFAWLGFDGIVIPEQAQFDYEGEDKIVPEFLVLDGQQRLTTIAHMLCGFTNGVWYLEIKKLFEKWEEDGSPLDSTVEIENWIASIPLAANFLRIGQFTENPGRNFTASRMSMPLQYAQNNESATLRIRELRVNRNEQAEANRHRARENPEDADALNEQAEINTDQADFVDVVVRKLLQGIYNYQIPSVEIPSGMDIDGICKVFTKINTTGVALGAFDLCVAMLYPQDIRLVSEFGIAMEDNQHLRAADEDKRTGVLASASLHNGTSPKTASLPRNITAEVFNEYWGTAVETCESACFYLTDYCGSALDTGNDKLLAYPTIIPPLSVIVGEYPIDEANVREAALLKRKIQAWYSSAAISRRYADGTDAKQVQDVAEMRLWFGSPDFQTLMPPWMCLPMATPLNETNATSAVGKSIMSVLNYVQARDWHSDSVVGKGGGRVESDIHHIFPKAAVREKIRQDTGLGNDEVDAILKTQYKIDNVANLAWVSSITNRDYIRARLPSEYIAELITHHAGGDTMEEGRRRLLNLLQDHAINDAALSALEDDDYFQFINIRSLLLIEMMRDRLYCSTIIHPDELNEDE